MYSIERQFVRVTESYKRLNERYKKARLREDALVAKAREQRAEIQQLKRQLREYEHTAARMSDVIAVVKYASAQAAIAGDHETSEKLSTWHESMSRLMKPVPQPLVSDVVALLRGWVESYELEDKIDRQSIDERRQQLRRDSQHVIGQLTGAGVQELP